MLGQSDIDRVTARVRSFLLGQYDHESVAMDICLESWQNGIDHPSNDFIKQRCLNQVRTRRQETKALESRKHEPRVEDTMEKEIQTRDEVNLLMGVLDNTQKKVLWYRFYQELPIREIAVKMKMTVDQVREMIEVALYKMRNAI